MAPKGKGILMMNDRESGKMVHKESHHEDLIPLGKSTSSTTQQHTFNTPIINITMPAEVTQHSDSVHRYSDWKFDQKYFHENDNR